MAFTVQEYHDLVQLLEQHPEWRSELRRLVLSDEVLALPESVRELTRAQLKTEEHLEALAEAQRRTEEHLGRLESRLELLVEQMRLLAESQQRMEVRLGRATGDLLELRYREHAAGYFGRWLRRARPVALQDIEESLEAGLSHEELLEVLCLDLLVSGQQRDRPAGPEIWLAVEVATVVDKDDVARAWRRATLLRQAGYRALPVVAGEKITPAAEASARARKVAVVQDGQGFLWDEALAAWPVE